MVTVPLDRLEEVGRSVFRDDGQNVFSDLLLPCPFCGERHCHEGGDEDHSGPYVQVSPEYGFERAIFDARVVCNTCHVSTTRSVATSTSVVSTGRDVTRLTAIAKAIDDWNRRA